MTKEVKEEARKLLHTLVAKDTYEIEKNRKQINYLSATNAALKRIRAAHIRVLRDFEKS